MRDMHFVNELNGIASCGNFDVRMFEFVLQRIIIGQGWRKRVCRDEEMITIVGLRYFSGNMLRSLVASRGYKSLRSVIQHNDNAERFLFRTSRGEGACMARKRRLCILVSLSIHSLNQISQPGRTSSFSSSSASLC